MCRCTCDGVKSPALKVRPAICFSMEEAASFTQPRRPRCMSSTRRDRGHRECSSHPFWLLNWPQCRRYGCGHYKNADQTLRSIATEAATLRTSIHQLQHLMQRDPAALSSRWDLESMLPQTFDTAIQAFQDVLDALLSELQKFQSTDKAGQSVSLPLTRPLKAKYLWNESAMQDLLLRLRAQQQSLQFLLSVLHIEMSSDIFNAVSENGALLRKLARSKTTKRSIQSVEEDIHSSSVDQGMGQSSKSSAGNLDSEPPTKRRSLSPEEDETSGPVSPARTRSGKIYHPSIGASAASAMSPKSLATDSKTLGAPTATPATSTRSTRQGTRSPRRQQSLNQNQYRTQGSGRYSLGRSLSPASSTLSSPITQPSGFIYITEESSPRWQGSSPNTQVSASEINYLAPMTKGKDVKAQLNTPKSKLAMADSSSPGAVRSGSDIGEDLSLESAHPSRLYEALGISVHPDMNEGSDSAISQKLSLPDIQAYRSPWIESDPQEDVDEFPGETSKSAYNDASLIGSTTRPSATKVDIVKGNTPRNTLVTGASGAAISKKSPKPTPYDDGADSTNYPVDKVEYGVSTDTLREPRYNTRSSNKYNISQDTEYDEEGLERTPQSLLQPIRRRAASSKPSTSIPGPSASPHKKPAPTLTATKADAERHRIPPGYSLKNWDPSEEPIILLGSVFDANSLGKWIYDWTVYHHGPATPIADMAGELWLLLIQLYGKIKRTEECMPRVRKAENREMLEDFIDGGERVAGKFQKLLKACEKPMLKAGRRNAAHAAQLSRNAGTEFVDSIFGQDRELVRTEKFMASVRLWNLRFDANCEEILRQPQQ